MNPQKTSELDETRPPASRERKSAGAAGAGQKDRPASEHPPSLLDLMGAAERGTPQAPSAKAAQPDPPAPVARLVQAHPTSTTPSRSSGPAGCKTAKKLSRLNATAAGTDNLPSDVLLDQFYTRLNVAVHCYRAYRAHVAVDSCLMVEPSAGMGAFYRLLPPGSIGCDKDPKYPGIETADFLTSWIETNRRIAIIGNPPFGQNCDMAVAFFNHAARQASFIGMILPRTFRKASILKRLNHDFHLLHEEVLPDNAFLFRNKPYNVPTVFQIWERRAETRELPSVRTRHPDFEFTTSDLADFAIQRVGARAGRVHQDFTKSDKSHYFIRGDVEHIMVQLQDDFFRVAADVAGNPSLAKSEIVSIYSEWLKQLGNCSDRMMSRLTSGGQDCAAGPIR